MAWGSGEKVLSEIRETRRALDDPATGLAAFHQDLDDLRSKVLETVSLGTTGLREENRELRRRQEKMLSDLGEVRTAIEALRREVANGAALSPGEGRLAAAAVGEGEAGESPVGAQRPGIESSDHSESVAREGGLGRMTVPGEAEEGFERMRPQSARSAAEADGDVAGGAGQKPLGGDEVQDAEAMEPRTESGDTTSDQEPEDRKDVRRRYRESLLSAAAISSARVLCHKDAWAFLVERTSQHPHFRLPDQFKEVEGGQVEAHLSGRSLLAVLDTMRTILDDATAGEDMAAWALSSAIYTRTELAVSEAETGSPDEDGVTTIVLDDRPDSGESG